MATKTFNFSWMGQYRSGSYYGSGSPIRVGGGYNYHSYMGFPSGVRDALNTSKTTPKIKIKLYVTNATDEWDFGGHKETYNKGSGSMPWYDYLGNFQFSPYNGTGWITFDITSKDSFMSRYKSGELQGIVLYSGTESRHYGEASNSGSTAGQIIVEGEWNDPPNPPKISYPTGGEIVDKSLTVKWTSGGDPDGDSLKYQVAFRGGDGGSWQYFTTGYGVTSYTIDTSSAVEGSRAQVAVRASDGQVWGEYAYSNYFTIDHNQPPSKPTQLSPANGAIVDRTDVLTFRWKHNDDGEQAGFRIAWRVVNSDGTFGAWNYIPSATTFQNTINQYYNMPANTLPNATIEWTVKTKDQQSEESDYANYVRIQSREPTNAPTILAPVNMSTISTTRVTVEWSSLNQMEYEVVLYDTNGLELFREAKPSNIKLITIPVDLENNKWYEVYVRVKDSVNQIWSDYATSSFGTSFNPPFPPVIKKTEEAGEGVLSVFFSAGEGNIAPDFYNDGEINELLKVYSATWDEVLILSENSVQLNQQGQSGVEYYLTENEISLVEGARYTLTATTDQAGGRLYLVALDENDASIRGYSTPNTLAEAPAGTLTASIILPAGTKKIRCLWYTTSDYVQGGIIHSDMKLSAEITDSKTTSLELFRREFTPTGTEPWIKVAKGLPLEGFFIDYTLATGTDYEYKVRAVNADNNTSTDSDVINVVIRFFETLLQEANNLSSIVLMKNATSREGELEIDSALQQFAGRRDPVREFGEAETLTLSIEWEVDTYSEVKLIRDMLRRRDILLYRDGYGRRYWMTTNGVQVQDKVVRGFILSTELTLTFYEEDIDKRAQEEELM